MRTPGVVARDWTLESLRRATISGLLVAAMLLFPAPSLKAGLFVAFLVFLFFLVRNPDGWARRLSYICTMVGVAVLAGLGAALNTAGFIEFVGTRPGLQWIVKLVFTLDDDSLTIGAGLILGGLVFGAFELIRQHLERKGNTEPESNAAPVLRLTDREGNSLSTTCTIAFRNPLHHAIRIGDITASPLGLVDSYLSPAIRIVRKVVLRPETRGDMMHEVEFTPDDPTLIEPGKGDLFQLRLELTDRFYRPGRSYKFASWFLGLRHRYFVLEFKSDGNEIYGRESICLLVT